MGGLLGGARVIARSRPGSQSSVVKWRAGSPAGHACGQASKSADRAFQGLQLFKKLFVL